MSIRKPIFALLRRITDPSVSQEAMLLAQYLGISSVPGLARYSKMELVGDHDVSKVTVNQLEATLRGEFGTSFRDGNKPFPEGPDYAIVQFGDKLRVNGRTVNITKGMGIDRAVQIYEMHAEGSSVDTIAKGVGTKAIVVNDYLKRAGLKVEPKKVEPVKNGVKVYIEGNAVFVGDRKIVLSENSLAPEKVAKIYERHLAGETGKAIAKAVECSQPTVYGYVRRLTQPKEIRPPRRVRVRAGGAPPDQGLRISLGRPPGGLARYLNVTA